MFNSFRNLQDDFECQTSGLCSINPSISVIDELILDELRQLSYYVVKIRELDKADKNAENQIIKIMCMDFLSSNFREKEYILFYKNLAIYKKQIEDKYRELCTRRRVRYEAFIQDKKTGLSVSEIINHGEENINQKNNFTPKDIGGLLELIVILSKIAGINVKKIKDYEPQFCEFDYEIIRFFSITNFPSTRKEKLLRRIGEFSNIMNLIFDKLSDVLDKNYGEKTCAKILTTPKKGKSILVSGDNLRELELLLEYCKDKDINIYTNGGLLAAHVYPKFQKYKNLIGHIETDSMAYDFSEFKGPIFLTKNSYFKTDSIYRGFLYTSSDIIPKGIGRIQDNDFSPLLNSADKSEGFIETNDEKTIDIDCDFNKIKNIIDKTKKNNFTIFIGNKEHYKEKNEIIELQPPNENDFLIKILEYTKDKNIDFEIIFEKCNIQVIALSIISSKYKNVKNISLSNCPRYYINPKISDCLKLNFKITI